MNKALPFLASLALTSFIGCLEQGDEKVDEEFEINPLADGKADGQQLIRQADRDAIMQSVDAVVADGESEVAAIESEIASLEQQHAAKKAEADRLVAQISAREQQLRDDYDRNIVLCALFPNPATCIFANYLANDSSLREYKRLLTDAQNKQAQINGEIDSYKSRRDTVRAEVEKIRSRRQALVTLLTNGVAGDSAPASIASSAELVGSYKTRSGIRKLRSSFAQEVVLLTELRDAAQELSESLDSAVRKLNTLLTSVDRLIEKQEEQFLKLLKAFVSGDPAAAADKWLNDVLAAKTKELLAGLDIATRDFVMALLKGDRRETDRALRDLLIEKLEGRVYPSATQATATSIRDLATTTSDVSLTGSSPVRLTKAKLSVDVKHDWVGDLQLVAISDGNRYLLQKNIGGSNKSIRKTFDIDLAAGDDGFGTWTLEIKDTERGDSGKLNSWSVALRP